YFKPDDVAGGCAARLHHVQSQLAEANGLTWYAAGDKPPATPQLLANAFEECGPFCVVTVCGHGHPVKAGIVLRADQIWRGDGCDLSRAGFLLLVSCSIGRLAGSVGQDVEGFCVELATHRALSTLACRWPVNGLEAVRFANMVVEEYLEMRS